MFAPVAWRELIVNRPADFSRGLAILAVVYIEPPVVSAPIVVPDEMHQCEGCSRVLVPNKNFLLIVLSLMVSRT